MKTYQITIEPLSPFGTPLKGDTLFGHFCWQAAYDSTLLARPLDELSAYYADRPFAVFSSAFPALPGGGVALKRPDLPLDRLFDFRGMPREEIIGRRKELKRRRWLVCRGAGALADLGECEYADDAALVELAAPLEAISSRQGRIAGIAKDTLASHNSINRCTGTTGEGFAPFSQKVFSFLPGIRLILFAGIEEEFLSRDGLRKGLERIGAFGYGRDASTGMGKFRVVGCETVNLSEYGGDSPTALYTLAPSVPEKGTYEAAYFSPFTRFGRHGDRVGKTGKPFKNPVIMADEGAVLVPKEMAAALARPYLGTGLTGLSKALEGTVGQGYTLYIPVGLEG